MVNLAIVIVSYNVCELLLRCLQSVYSSSNAEQLSVCVVDNYSQDSTVEMIRSTFPQVELIANDNNPGYPAANNQGLVRLGATSKQPGERPKYALLLNPDTEVPGDAFARMIAFMDERPDVGIAGPKLILPDGTLDLACRRSFPTPTVSAYRMLGLSKIFPESRRFGRYNMTFLDENEQAEVDSVVGAFMMIRTDAIAEAGLMDERFWMYGEDLDWAKRIKEHGWKVVYYPEVTVLHVKRASSRQSKRAQFEFYRAMLIFYYKHYYNETPRLLHWFILLALAIKGGRRLLPDIKAGPAILTAGRA